MSRYFRQKESGGEILVALVLVIVVGVGLAPLNGMALAYTWNQLVVPTWGVEPIVWRQAFGASILLGVMGLKTSSTSNDDSVWDSVGRVFISGLIVPVVIFAFVWAYSLWL